MVADRVTARDSVHFDRGEIEIGMVVAQSLTVAKGTVANILITEVLKLEGAITKGGYENFAEFLAKVLLYHPEILNDRFGAEARKTTPGAGASSAATPSTGTPSPFAVTDASEDPAADALAATRLGSEATRLRSWYQDKETPREIAELLGMIDGRRVGDVRRNLSPLYQRLAPQGKMLPEPVMEIFRDIQKVLRETTRPRKETRPA